MIYVLICADEGYTKHLYVAEDTVSLRQVVTNAFLLEERTETALPGGDINLDFLRAQREALLRMLDQIPTDPGRYRLPPCEPWYEEWTLWITEVPAGSLDY